MPNILGDLHKKFMWCTRGENCPICDSLRGRVYTYDMWMSAGVWPGFHLNCDCFLKEVTDQTIVSDPDFFGTDLNLLSDAISRNPLFPNFYLNPAYKPFSWYMTEQITKAHITYGANKPIGEAIRSMRDDWEGFFKRSTFYDNFFVWRTFKTVQHYEKISGDLSGELPWWKVPINRRVGFRSLAYYLTHTIYASDIARFQFPYLNFMLYPDSLDPYYPYQSYYQDLD